jgi:iturin family lipopeptide synthetase A
MEMRFSYSTWRFKPSTIRTMSRHYLEILRQVLEEPEIRLKDLKISHTLSPASTASEEEEPGDFDFNLN